MGADNLPDNGNSGTPPEKMTLPQCVEEYKFQARQNNALLPLMNEGMPENLKEPFKSLTQEGLPKSLGACVADVRKLMGENRAYMAVQNASDFPTAPSAVPAPPVNKGIEGPGS